MSTREPMHFDVTLAQAGGQSILSAGPRPTIAGGAPPEFGGSAEVWSPEHLLVASAALCFLTTFEWFARRATLPVVAFHCHAEGTVKKSAHGLGFTGVTLQVHAEVPPGEAQRARELLTTAKRGCLVANSLSCPVELVADVVETGAAATPAAS